LGEVLNMTSEVRLNMRGELDHLQLSWQMLENVLETLPFSGDATQERYNILLAVQEALTNVLRHGYGGDEASSNVELRIQALDDHVTLELWDDAPAFDPTQQGARRNLDDAEQLPEGGYGIEIIREVMDSVGYQRRDNHNVLILEKQLATVEV